MTTAARDAYRGYFSAGDAQIDHAPRYLWTIATFLGDVAGQRVLEIGCGDGGCIALLRERNAVVGVDASESGVRACRALGIDARLLDLSIEPLPFDAETFDVVICLETFEHLTNPQHAIDEIARVLKRNGRLVSSIPNPRTGHPYLYPGLFTFANFKRFLEQNGFSVRRVEPWGFVPREALLPRGLRRNRVATSRWVAGAARRIVHLVLARRGRLPRFLSWLWTFDAVRNGTGHGPGMVITQARWGRSSVPSRDDTPEPRPAHDLALEDNRTVWALRGADLRESRLQKAIRLIQEERPGRLLDLGCGAGEIGSVFLESGWRVFGLDVVEPQAARAARRGVRAVAADGSVNVPFRADAFDVVFAGEIIEHLLDTDGFLSEIRRVLRGSGVLVITTPNLASFENRLRLLLGRYPVWVDYRLGSSGHVRAYTPRMLRAQLARHGFRVERHVGNWVPLVPQALTDDVRRTWLRVTGDWFPNLAMAIIMKCRKIE